MPCASDSAAEKRACREQVRQSMAVLDNQTRAVFSARACENAASLPAFKRAGILLAYKPIRGECSPDALVDRARRSGKRVAFPLCLEDHGLALYIAESEEDFTSGAYGISEPDPKRCRSISAAEIDFAVIPGIAFDTECNRLGRGAGYYDRLLNGFCGVKAGFAYQCQIFPSVPVQEHDIKMDFVVTNNGIIVNNRQ